MYVLCLEGEVNFFGRFIANFHVLGFAVFNIL